MEGTARLLHGFLTPDLDPIYLVALLWSLLETLGMTIAAMTLVFIISLPLAVASALGYSGARLLVNTLSLLRALPDLTLAILCVILFGIGPEAGMIALVVYYTASVSKVFADLLDTAPRAPLEALRCTGAGSLQVVMFGKLPLVRDALLNYGAFSFECALRSSVVIGAVGGGGIGTELVGALAVFEFGRAATQLVLLIALVAVIDRLSVWLRTRRVRVLWLAPIGLALALHFWPAAIDVGHTWSVLAKIVPPALPDDAFAHLPRLIWETIWMAFVGTTVASLIAILAALMAARSIAPPAMVFISRRLLESLRAIPEVIWGLIIVSIAVIGPLAGAIALGLHTLGSMGRIFADTFDTAPKAERDALAATGASPLIIGLFAALPLSVAPLASHVLFRFEWNLRMATVMGLIGAGGVGQALHQSQQLFQYREALSYVLVTAALVLLSDKLGGMMRASLGAGAAAVREVGCQPAKLRPV